jgi:hypothetical protein
MYFKKIGTYKEINDELEIGNIFDDLNIDIDTQYNNINELNVYSKKELSKLINDLIIALFKKVDLIYD